jgi:hypothetical protein
MLVFGEKLFLICIFLIFLSFLFLMFSKDKNKFFYLYWIGLSIIFILNPFVSKYIINYIAFSSVYWRLFFILPFPFVLVFLFKKFLRLIRIK